jgi:hypothetical protein
MSTTGNARPHHKTHRNPHIPLTLLSPAFSYTSSQEGVERSLNLVGINPSFRTPYCRLKRELEQVRQERDILKTVDLFVHGLDPFLLSDTPRGLKTSGFSFQRRR